MTSVPRVLKAGTPSRSSALISSTAASASNLLFGACVALQVFDGVATYLGLRAGYVEANPLLRIAMDSSGILALLLFKLYLAG